MRLRYGNHQRRTLRGSFSRENHAVTPVAGVLVDDPPRVQAVPLVDDPRRDHAGSVTAFLPPEQERHGDRELERAGTAVTLAPNYCHSKFRPFPQVRSYSGTSGTPGTLSSARSSTSCGPSTSARSSTSCGPSTALAGGSLADLVDAIDGGNGLMVVVGRADRLIPSMRTSGRKVYRGHPSRSGRQCWPNLRRGLASRSETHHRPVAAI
jgi:hypothetical protein